MRLAMLCMALGLAACTDEQSSALGNAPKSTIDRATTGVNKALQQGTERGREAQENK